MPSRKRPGLDTVAHPDGVHRDQWTRPIYPVLTEPGAMTKCKLCKESVDGRPFTRMTRFIDVLGDKFALERWFQRLVIKGIVLKDHLQLKAANALNPDDPLAEREALDAVAKEAAEAAGSEDASSKGTELHRTIEAVLRNEQPKVPAAFRPDIAALYECLQSHRLTAHPDDLEVNVVIDGVKVQKTAAGIGGRFDVIFTLPTPCPGCDATRRIGDFKTGQVWYHGCDKKKRCGRDTYDCPKRIMYGSDEFRMQLAGYASAKRIDGITGERTDLNVCQCYGYVVHIPAGEGRCEVLIVDLERGRYGLNEAYRKWRWRDNNGPLSVLLPDVSMSTAPEPPAPPVVAASDGKVTPEGITSLIRVAADRNNLLGLRRYFMASGEWTTEHDQQAAERVAEVEGKTQ